LAVLDAILFSAHKALLMSEMHIATVKESFETLAGKNRELEAMNERMKEFERMKSSFLSTISHELRTPLTSIIGYSDMLAEGIAGKLADEQKQFIETIKIKGEELLRLISAILDFSQIETGHLSLNPTEVEPIALIKNAVAEADNTAQRRGIRLALNAPGELRSVSLDAEKIESVLGHLIDNAIKFSPPGAVVRVSADIISTEEAEDDEDAFGFVLMAAPDWLVISIQDFGAGIAPQDQEVIFAPFTQLDDSSTREHGGAGLGLALVKQFVEAHGGKVEVMSTPSEGSNFTIHLPILSKA
jgi:signal transduction histidine kinase